jgi:stage II sporulation protein D
MARKTLSNGLHIAVFSLAFTAAFAQEKNFLSIRILEKPNPSELGVQSPPNKGDWSEVKLTRGFLTVNGKAQEEASWGTLDSTVKIKTGDLTRIYPGRIRVSVRQEAKGPELYILNEVSAQDYAACVCAFESGYNRSQPEYLKALAVVIRTYASSHRHRHPGYDLCDLAHCQIYQGLPPGFDFWKLMAAAGKDFRFPTSFDLKSLYFNRCCGGVLESADQVWGGDPSPSKTGPDELGGETLCKADPFYRWKTAAEAKDIESIFKTMAHLSSESTLKSFSVGGKTKHGRNQTLAATFEWPGGETREIREYTAKFVSEFGRRYGWRVFPSLWFDIEKRGHLYHFSGRGFGHGVGLCQSGALRLAQKGFTWKKILDFYFPYK